MAVSDTLRGYRTQFLYTLYRILKTTNPENEVFRPEGIEDLDILVYDKVVESIQVKNHRSGKLGYENLKSSPVLPVSFCVVQKRKELILMRS